MKTPGNIFALRSNVSERVWGLKERISNACGSRTSTVGDLNWTLGKVTEYEQAEGDSFILPLWQRGSRLEAKGEAVAEARGMAGGTNQQISSSVKRVSVGSSQSSHEQHPPSLSEFGINERRTRHVGTKTSTLQKAGLEDVSWPTKTSGWIIIYTRIKHIHQSKQTASGSPVTSRGVKVYSRNPVQAARIHTLHKDWMKLAPLAPPPKLRQPTPPTQSPGQAHRDQLFFPTSANQKGIKRRKQGSVWFCESMQHLTLLLRAKVTL